jgi:hypothetical protein
MKASGFQQMRARAQLAVRLIAKGGSYDEKTFFYFGKCFSVYPAVCHPYVVCDNDTRN